MGNITLCCGQHFACGLRIERRWGRPRGICGG